MAYYQRWQNDLSGGGRYEVYHWPDSDDNDVFFILKPFAAIAGLVFKLPLFKNLIGFIVGLPIAIFAFVALVLLFICIMFFGYMYDCWEKIVKTYCCDMMQVFKWAYWKLCRKNNKINMDPAA